MVRSTEAKFDGYYEYTKQEIYDKMSGKGLLGSSSKNSRWDGAFPVALWKQQSPLARAQRINNTFWLMEACRLNMTWKINKNWGKGSWGGGEGGTTPPRTFHFWFSPKGEPRGWWVVKLEVDRCKSPIMYVFYPKAAPTANFMSETLNVLYLYGRSRKFHDRTAVGNVIVLKKSKSNISLTIYMCPRAVGYDLYRAAWVVSKREKIC